MHLRDWVILKKRDGVWFSLFHKFELLTATTFLKLDLILDCNIPKFKLKYQQIRNGRANVFGTPSTFPNSIVGCQIPAFFSKIFQNRVKISVLLWVILCNHKIPAKTNHEIDLDGGGGGRGEGESRFLWNRVRFWVLVFHDRVALSKSGIIYPSVNVL